MKITATEFRTYTRGTLTFKIEVPSLGNNTWFRYRSGGGCVVSQALQDDCYNTNVAYIQKLSLATASVIADNTTFCEHHQKYCLLTCKRIKENGTNHQ